MRERTGELRYTSAPRRRDEILRRMRSAGYVSAPDLSADLSVSGRTVRRDLQKLADLGLVELVYGGALAPGGVTPGSSFGARSRHSPARSAPSPTGHCGSSRREPPPASTRAPPLWSWPECCPLMAMSPS
jgi:hypothetical protein